MAVPSWTQEQTERLTELWKQGATATEIALELGGGITRNAVCGKIDRLGLSGKRRAHKMRVARKAGSVAAAPKPKAPPMQPLDRLKSGIDAQVNAINRSKKISGPPTIKEDFKARLADVDSRRLTIIELMAMECRWADEDRNEDGQHTFCGNPTGDGSSYCPAHAALARGVGTASERAVAPILDRRAA